MCSTRSRRKNDRPIADKIDAVSGELTALPMRSAAFHDAMRAVADMEETADTPPYIDL